VITAGRQAGYTVSLCLPTMPEEVLINTATLMSNRHGREIMADRKTVEHNPRALASRMRKEALTIEEAFSIDGEDCAV
jgi:hypothetical protein